MILRGLLASVLGVTVMFGLLLLMQQLIATGNRTLDESETLHFVDFVRMQRDETPETKDRKPERPPKPEEPPPPAQEEQQRMVDQVGDTGFSLGPGRVDTELDLAAGLGLSTAEGDYLPIVKIAPNYPRRAQTRGIEGYVILEFTVTRTGRVADPRVIEAEPPGIFDRAAMDAAKKFKYKPRVVDGEPIDVPGVKHRITFRLEE